jgi:Peptidase family M28
VGSPPAGGALILAALISLFSDALVGVSLGRRLTPERASQNVVIPAAPAAAHEPPVRLILTANYDAPRTGIAYWNAPRRAAARIRTITRGLTPGWQGWLAIALVWLGAAVIARVTGSKGTAIGIAQFPPTVGLLIGFALLLDVASADFSAGANDNGSGVAVSLALVRALQAAPPRRLAVEVVLTGAGDTSSIGLRRYLRARRRELTPRTSIVLGLAPCGSGAPRWWVSDGSLLPLRSFATLRRLSERVARGDPGLEARPQTARGTSPAFPARLARLPTITLGCLDDRGLAPRSHQRQDTPDAIDEHALDRAVEFGLLLIDAIDAFLATERAASPAGA